MVCFTFPHKHGHTATSIRPRVLIHPLCGRQLALVLCVLLCLLRPPVIGPAHEVQQASQLFREHGTRLTIAKKNIGKAMYSFNAFQRMMLPLPYTPPAHTAAGGTT